MTGSASGASVCGVFEDFGASFGAHLRQLRTDAGASQDDLARAVTRTGLVAWSRARVGQVEAGGGAPDLAAMCAVASALRELTGRPVRLADLVSESPLRQALLGLPVELVTPTAGLPPDPRHVPGWGQVEDRVVAQLGSGSEAAVAAMARKLYGRMGSEERDARAGEGASPQKRGREARVVIAELAAAVQDVSSGRRK